MLSKITLFLWSIIPRKVGEKVSLGEGKWNLCFFWFGKAITYAIRDNQFE